MALSATLELATTGSIAFDVTVTGGTAPVSHLLDLAESTSEAFDVTTTGGARTAVLDLAESHSEAFPITWKRSGARLIPQPASSTLGCGAWSAYLTRRGGSPRIIQVDFSSLSINRVLDNAGTANFSIPAADCGELFSDIDAWRDEIIVYRDNEVAFVGPVITPEGEVDGSIFCQDLSAWLDVRFNEEDRYSFGDVSEAFQMLFNAAMELDPSPALSLDIHNTGVKATRSYKGADFANIGGLLKELARTAIDYTVIGRTMYAGGKEVFEPLSNPGLPTILHDQGCSAKVTKDGTQFASDVAVFAGNNQSQGSQQPGDVQIPLTGRATGATDVYGLVQRTFTELQIQDLESVNNNALGRLLSSQPAPLRVKATLNPDAAFTFHDLVPGRRVDVRLAKTPIKVMEMMRIVSVNISVDESGDETITLQLVPLGQTEGEG